MPASRFLTKNLPFAGLGFQVRPIAVQALVRLRNVLVRVFRTTLLRRQPRNPPRTPVRLVFGYELLVMQAREIRGQ
ncbi:hypothetical protein [Desulfonatronum thioautotrophicum]|uniref:hypothetical protein n=1 Tax=Desulfonatronum thioautotrophicum TaxID=617001 RepID=UPI00129463FA|nr:hypothetical protein [Desulfonatronum thioautotrophicum]